MREAGGDELPWRELPPCGRGCVVGRWRSERGGGRARRATAGGEDGRRREVLPRGRCRREVEVEVGTSFAGGRCYAAGGVAGRWSRWGGGCAQRGGGGPRRRTGGGDERRRRELLPCRRRRREVEVEASTSRRAASFPPSWPYPPPARAFFPTCGFFPAHAVARAAEISRDSTPPRLNRSIPRCLGLLGAAESRRGDAWLRLGAPPA